MNRRETTQAREAREKENAEDARRLREFPVFAKTWRASHVQHIAPRRPGRGR